MAVNFQKVEFISKKTRVAQALREAILAGSLKPSDALVETRLAQQFGVGQGLIREALIELEQRGFVERTPFSGTRVIDLTLADTEQIFDVRIELEPLAYQLAAGKAQAADLEALGESVEVMKQFIAAGNITGFFEANLLCRHRIWELSGSPFLVQTLDRLVAPLFALYIITENFNHAAHLQVAQRSLAAQAAAVRALQTGDAAEASRLAREFLQVTKNSLHLLLADRHKG